MSLEAPRASETVGICWEVLRFRSTRAGSVPGRPGSPVGRLGHWGGPSSNGCCSSGSPASRLALHHGWASLGPPLPSCLAPASVAPHAHSLVPRILDVSSAGSREATQLEGQ